MQVQIAEVEINCPAVAIDTWSEPLISVKMPVTIMTPVPITMLPNISGHRTRGKEDFKGLPKGSFLGAVSAPHLQSTRIDDVGRRSLDEVDHVVKCSTKVQLVVVLFDVADVRRADAVF